MNENILSGVYTRLDVKNGHYYILFLLLIKVVRLFCLKLKISITTELVEFSFLDPGIVLGYFIFMFEP